MKFGSNWDLSIFLNNLGLHVYKASLELFQGVLLSKEALKCCNSPIGLCLGVKKKKIVTNEIVQINALRN